MRKRLLFLTVFNLLLAFNSCRSITEPGDGKNPELFEVHLWGSFRDDWVRVKIDGAVQFEGQVTAEIAVDNVKSFRAHLDNTYNPHVISAEVNGEYSSSATFNSADTLVVTVRFDPATKQFYFNVLNKKPLYG